MENTEDVITARGTNPFMTVLLFGIVIAVLVTSGSYFSKQRMDARDTELGVTKIPVFSMAVSGR